MSKTCGAAPDAREGHGGARQAGASAIAGTGGGESGSNRGPSGAETQKPTARPQGRTVEDRAVEVGAEHRVRTGDLRLGKATSNDRNRAARHVYQEDAMRRVLSEAGRHPPSLLNRYSLTACSWRRSAPPIRRFRSRFPWQSLYTRAELTPRQLATSRTVRSRSCGPGSGGTPRATGAPNGVSTSG